MNKTLLLLLLISSFNASANPDTVLQTKIFDLKSGQYILPIQKDAVTSIIQEFSDDLKSETSNEQLKEKGFSVEVKESGDCGASNSNCRGSLIGRRFFQIQTNNLKAAVDVYTSDLRNSNDKQFKVSGIAIERHHWDITAAGATKVENEPLPMSIGQEYIIKKCRNGFMVDWKCNSIAYELISLDESTFALIGRQSSTDHEPASYSSHKCQNGQSNCLISFLALQKKNSSSGILSLTLFKSTLHKVSIIELNLSSVEDSGEVMKLTKGQHLIESGMEQEYNLLRAKFSALNDTAKIATSNSSDLELANLKSMRYFLLLLAGAFAAMTTFYARKKSLI